MLSVAAVGGVEDVLDAAASRVAENPLLAVAVLIALLVLIGMGWVLSNRFGRPSGVRFENLLDSCDRVGVLMHPNPDPDAMACGLAVQELADQVDTGTTLYYSGQIRHQENRAFATVLNGEFDRIQSASDIAESDVVLVDHNEPRGFAGSEHVDPVAVVDHHPGDGSGTQFTDVRIETGACATILSEYFEQLGYEPVDPDDITNGVGGDRMSPRVSTGLVYGIQSDTKHLTKGCSSAEFDAASFLYPGIDQDKLDRIANPEVDAEVLDIKAMAIRERTVRNPFAISDVGTVSNVDAIPQAADELLRLEAVTVVVVFAEKDETIHLSGRSRDDRVHIGRTLEAVVEDIPMASAGGHARMGGGQLSTTYMEELGPGTGLSRGEFKERLFEAMSGDV